MPIVAIALGALGGAVLVRWLKTEMQRINAELQEMRVATAPETAANPVRTLRKDPLSGVYRPD